MPKAKMNVVDITELATKFGKPDVERIGLFIEMPYLSAKTHPPKKKQSDGRNIMCEGHKTKNGTQHGYFDDTFKRVFSKEALTGRGRKQPPPKYKNVSERPFMPPAGFKLHSSPGDYYGTFSGIIEAVSNKRRPKPPFKPELRNFVTSPAKKGSYGNYDTALSPYPEHKPDRYGLKPKYKEYGKMLGRPMVNIHYPKPYFDDNPFRPAEKIKPGPTYAPPKEKPVKMIPPGHILPTGPAKWQGGCHDGCFNKFPEHQTDRVKAKTKPQVKTEGIFYPTSNATKTFYTFSVVNLNVDFRMTKDNYNDFEPVYVKHLMTD